jgi:hypothetical protein
VFGCGSNQYQVEANMDLKMGNTLWICIQQEWTVLQTERGGIGDLFLG